MNCGTGGLKSMLSFPLINRGDVVLIQSNVIHTLLTHKCTVKDILNSFLESVGSEGTCVFPTFSTGFAHGVPFDIRNTRSHVGILSEMARKHPNAIRSGHPMQSFVAIGKDAEKFNVNNYSGYGSDSPFGVLRRLNGKIGLLGIPDSKGNSSYHHIEQMNGVKYRILRQFTENYTDWDGKTEKRTYELFVRDPKGTVRVSNE
jgi:aminoglycoside 3-N-acetyltransferase